MAAPDNPPQAPVLNTTLVSKLDPKAKRQQANATGMLALLVASYRSVGIAGLLVGTIFGGMALSAKSTPSFARIPTG